MLIKLKHHYGNSCHRFEDDINHQLAAYLSVRKACNFLTNDNHNFRVLEKEIIWGGEKINFNSVTIYYNAKNKKRVTVDLGWDSLYTDNEWFSMEYSYNKKIHASDENRFYSYKRKALTI